MFRRSHFFTCIISWCSKGSSIIFAWMKYSQCDTLMAFQQRTVPGRFRSPHSSVVRHSSRIFLCSAYNTEFHGISKYHRPPCIGKLDSIKTITLTPPHNMGIHVDIRKLPDSYVAPSLFVKLISQPDTQTIQPRTKTYTKPTILPAISACNPPITAYMTGITQPVFQFRHCMITAQAATEK